MKISFILPDLNLSGGNRVVAIYADELAARGHQVSVIAPRRKPPDFRRRVASLIKKGHWLSYTPYDETYFRNSRAKITILRSPDPVADQDIPDGDIIVATWWETAEWVETLSSAKGIKTLFIQGYEIREDASAALTSRLKATWRLPFHKIVVSEWLQEIARNEFGVDPTAVVPNGVDLELFRAPGRTRQRVPTVGLLYSPAPFKGIDIAIKAINLARGNLPELRTVSFGAVEPVASPALPDNTSYRLTPPQDTIPNIYSRCDAWLFPSRREGFGLPILEAMACRTPVIATPAGAAPELVSEGGGILVEPENPQAMADAIESLFLMTDSQWQDVSNKALATAKRHNWRVATDAFEKAMYKILGSPTKETPNV